jgi:hypothetical protein
MLLPRVEAGALGARARGGPLCAGKRWPIRVVYLREHQQWDDRGAQRRKEGLDGGPVVASWGEDRCLFRQTGQFGTSAWEEGLWSWETFCRNECWRLLFPQSRAAKRSKN